MPARSQWLDNFGAFTPLSLELAPVTVVFDRKHNRQVMRIQGVATLPVGAEIELADPNVKATVIGVRLLAGAEGLPVMVCLDVEVPEAFWAEVLGSSGT